MGGAERRVLALRIAALARLLVLANTKLLDAVCSRHPIAMAPLFTWQVGSPSILLTEDALSFISGSAHAHQSRYRTGEKYITVKIKWHKQIFLGTKRTFKNTAAKLDLTTIPDAPGIYVFARRFGSTLVPIYIGRTLNLRMRLKTQFNNHKLMEALANEKIGDRVLLCGSITSNSRPLLKRKLVIAERAHIAHSLTANHPLVNIQLTKRPADAIEIDGVKTQDHPFPRTMLSKV